MSDKKYSPEEVAIAVLKKTQEVYNKHKTEKSDVEKCGEISKADEPKELKKLMAPTSTASGSVATTGGPSIASQIGFGKSDEKEDEKKDKKKKLPEFLKNKMKKAMGDAAEAPKAPKSGSPQPSSVSLDSGWSDSAKVGKK